MLNQRKKHKCTAIQQKLPFEISTVKIKGQPPTPQLEK